MGTNKTYFAVIEAKKGKSGAIWHPTYRTKDVTEFMDFLKQKGLMSK